MILINILMFRENKDEMSASSGEWSGFQIWSRENIGPIWYSWVPLRCRPLQSPKLRPLP